MIDIDAEAHKLSLSNTAWENTGAMRDAVAALCRRVRLDCAEHCEREAGHWDDDTEWRVLRHVLHRLAADMRRET